MIASISAQVTENLSLGVSFKVRLLSSDFFRLLTRHFGMNCLGTVLLV